MIPDLIIKGQAVSRAEVAAATAPIPADLIVVGDAPARDPHATRNRFTEHLIKHGSSAEYAVKTAKRTAERADRRYPDNRRA